MITITNKAQDYLTRLTKLPEHKSEVLRLVALDPYTPYAEAGLQFAEVTPELTEDVQLSYGELVIYIEGKHKRLLEDALIDLRLDGLGEQLVIDTPNLQPTSLLDSNAPFAEQINYLIETEINPGLASHGGRVQLVKITPENEIYLQFGGGCQGCGMVDVTLKQGIEETLKSRLPQIKAIHDATDHGAGKNPYY